ncbi:hypothetical protein [Cellulophaga sp. 20_2_10]|uniref:hypothetical protein n=1 Tax=Cellulophaga sp. 20_2_10 TaxID=2942476 RepID=UPI00201A700B|nr:hypothetical protein [Cellulophaga sp. 20_2_10]
MKLKSILPILLLFIFFSCKEKVYKANADGFIQIDEVLKKKFGKDALYTDIILQNYQEKGIQVDATVTNTPESLRMEGWSFKDNAWAQLSEISLKLEKGEIENYMFSLQKEIDISSIDGLVKRAIKTGNQNTSKKELILHKIVISSPLDGNKSGLEYHIQLKSKIDSTTYNYYYLANGEPNTIN